MKFKLTNVSGQQIQESLPTVTRINLLPGESCIVSDVTVGEAEKAVTYKAEEIVRLLKQGRKPFGDDLVSTPFLEDHEAAKILGKFPATAEKPVSGINPAFAALMNKEKEASAKTLPPHIVHTPVPAKPSLFESLPKKG
jgi:hypothetical protein